MGVARTRSFRLHGPVHRGVVPWLTASTAASALGIWALASEGPAGWLDLHDGIGFVLTVCSTALAINLVGKASIGYGVVPLIVVWRHGGATWAGTLTARWGLSRRRIRLDSRDIQVGLLDSARPQPKEGHIAYPRVTSGGASLELRTHGTVDAQELQEFLLSRAGAYEEFSATEGDTR